MSPGGHVGSSCTGERCLLSHSLDWFPLSSLMGDGIFFSQNSNTGTWLVIACLCGGYISIACPRPENGLFDGYIDWKIAIIGAIRRDHNDDAFVGNHRPS